MSYPHDCAVSPSSSGNMRVMERVTAFYEERMSVIKNDLKKDDNYTWFETLFQSFTLAEAPKARILSRQGIK